MSWVEWSFFAAGVVVVGILIGAVMQPDGAQEAEVRGLAEPGG